MHYTLLVTGPAYGTQQSSSAFLFSRALLEVGYNLRSVFFYSEGVLNANRFIIPYSGEFDLVREWELLYKNFGIKLNVCASAALRRGVMDSRESSRLKLIDNNLQSGFELVGLSVLIEEILRSDRMVQF